MEITSNKEEIIFKKDYNNKPIYTIGLSKKDKDGNYENGYLQVRFKKDVELENKTKIKIKNAWLDFYNKDKKTYPYIFINEFEIININPYKEMGEHIKTEFDIGHQIQIDDKDLPF